MNAEMGSQREVAKPVEDTSMGPRSDERGNQQKSFRSIPE